MVCRMTEHAHLRRQIHTSRNESQPFGPVGPQRGLWEAVRTAPMWHPRTSPSMIRHPPPSRRPLPLSSRPPLRPPPPPAAPLWPSKNYFAVHESQPSTAAARPRRVRRARPLARRDLAGGCPVNVFAAATVMRTCRSTPCELLCGATGATCQRTTLPRRWPASSRFFPPRCSVGRFARLGGLWLTGACGPGDRRMPRFRLSLLMCLCSCFCPVIVILCVRRFFCTTSCLYYIQKNTHSSCVQAPVLSCPSSTSGTASKSNSVDPAEYTSPSAEHLSSQRAPTRPPPKPP